MAKPKVVVARMTPGLEESPIWTECDVWAWREDRTLPGNILMEQAAQADGLYTTGFDPVTPELLSVAQNLKVVSNYGVGVDNINLSACTARGIRVGNTPGVVTEATADLAFALMLSLSRRIVTCDNLVKAREWKAWSPTLLIANDVFGKTLGIVGMGRIGQAIAKRATGFSMNLLYHTRTRRPEAEREFGVQYRSLEDLLRQSDIVLLILPLTPETHHLINAAALAKMKPSALLINAARGAIVDPKALYDTLAAKRIAGAALDVTVPEPIKPEDPLLTLDNILITPHIGTSTWEARRLMTDMAVRNLIQGLNGETMPALANPEVLKH
ncbi:MAG: D-glycerate dehydrogenase [Deltaproteobacteria bacterium]|nr:D-glycerate dehydrogenase [Deltaproteobacteria bacterium]